MWPCTFNPCKCGRGMTRGIGPCSVCVSEQLEDMLPNPHKHLAEDARAALLAVGTTWEAIRKALNEGDDEE